MNIETLKMLSKNPHYKLTPKQKEELAERKPMVEFGVPNLHNNTFEKHETETKKKRKKVPHIVSH
jgi:DNA-binding PadR family transcriptional regulator